MKEWDWKRFIKAALIRAIRTFAQTAVGFITVGMLMKEVPWTTMLSVSAVAAVYSLINSIITGLPEVDE